jgi:hypothetical protein
MFDRAGFEKKTNKPRLLSAQPYHLTMRLAIALAVFACVALGLISGAYYASRRAALPARLLIISGAVAVVVYALWISTSLRI